MTDIIKECSCSGGDCCPPKPEKKKIDIDFLYLDLTTCQRCQGTDSNLDQAIKEVSTVLKYAAIEVNVDKINISTPELATQYEFLSSPTIRINGYDIALEVAESLCENCGDICGDSVDCRSWVYEGIEYQEPPKEMIVNVVMKAVYGDHPEAKPEKSEYGRRTFKYSLMESRTKNNMQYKEQDDEFRSQMERHRTRCQGSQSPHGVL